jgi:hypothetical protein
MPRPSHSSRFHHPHNSGWGVQSCILHGVIFHKVHIYRILVFLRQSWILYL